jgi:hypothetical protein
MNHNYDRIGKRIIAWLVLALATLMVIVGITSGIWSSEQVGANDWLPTVIFGVTGIGLSSARLLPPTPKWLRKGARNVAMLGALSGILLLVARIWW